MPWRLPHLVLVCLGLWSARAADLVDPTTATIDPSALTKDVDGRSLTLVMSDEFSVDVPAGAFGTKVKWNSSLDTDSTVKWQASDALSYNTYGDSYMRPENLVVQDGVLNITGGKGSKFGSTYEGAQITSWNRVCFQGGYLEVRFRMPGSYGMDGLWPAIWTMGNLLRDNHLVRNRNIWPYSYSECTCPGTAFWGVLKPPAVSACSPKQTYGLNAFQGRGAPELDLLETTKCGARSRAHPRRGRESPRALGAPRAPFEPRPLRAAPWQVRPLLHRPRQELRRRLGRLVPAPVDADRPAARLHVPAVELL